MDRESVRSQGGRSRRFRLLCRVLVRVSRSDRRPRFTDSPTISARIGPRTVVFGPIVPGSECCQTSSADVVGVAECLGRRESPGLANRLVGEWQRFGQAAEFEDALDLWRPLDDRQAPAVTPGVLVGCDERRDAG